MIRELLYANPILTLFLIIGLGRLLGKIRIGNFSLGIAAVLFAGLAVSAYDPKLALPTIVYVLGLVLFVYSIGLASGPSFILTLKNKGFRTNGFVLAVLVIGFLLTIAAAKLFHIERTLAAGVYTGAFTNTPALASLVDTLHHQSIQPVIGYSLTYPMGVLATLAMLYIFQKLYGARAAAKHVHKEPTLYARTVRYTRQEHCRVEELAESSAAEISVSRIDREGRVHVAKPTEFIRFDDLVTIVGTTEALDDATKWMGVKITSGKHEVNHSNFHTRRIFLSNWELAGKTLSTINLQQNWHVVATRVRRGDIDIVAHDDMKLELGDRIKIVGAYEDVQKTAGYLGDSYVSTSELHILTFTIGIVLGILVGLIPLPLPGGGVFHLGVAGGTLLVALVLGAVGRTGKIVWQIPFSTNMTIRQIGVTLFLAGIGSQAGGSLGKALSDPTSIKIVAIGAVLTMIISLIALFAGYLWLKVPYSQMGGFLAGMQTQPAILAVANEQIKGEAPNIGYASVYPAALILKIVFAQLLLVFLL